ncbi:MAG: DASS family sodium-coupled anion symporter [Pseudomonadota bacterium]|nr:DASS family sodium-coupled anion symporter [Pseudomonadota bacterium]
MSFTSFFKFLVGPALALLVQQFDIPGLSNEGQNMLAVAIVMAVWWATEALPLAVTSLTPIILLPALDIMPMAQTTGSYAHPVTFLLFGGFVLALAIERCGLHIRSAYGFLSLIRAQARYLVAVLMGVAAVTSMWISNTATTLMLLPVAISVTRMMRQHLTGLTAKQLNDFDVSVFLGLAFAATLGGMATMIGTAPNSLAVGFIQTTYNIEIGFLDWMMFAVPLMFVMLPLVWFVLTRITNPVSFAITPDTQQEMRRHYHELGALSTYEKRVLGVFVITVLAWILRKYIVGALGISGITDTTVAIGAVFLLFTVPAGERDGALLDWTDLTRMPWGALLLFGGGFALAAGISDSGLSNWIGAQLAVLAAAPVVVILLCLVALIVFLTEITSNTATTTTFLPVIAALALEIGQPPLMLIIPATLAASCAFMFPVATPPNAIVFGSGQVNIANMVRAGFWINLLGVGVLTMLALYLVPRILSV